MNEQEQGGQSGAGYGNSGEQMVGGMESSGGTGSDGGMATGQAPDQAGGEADGPQFGGGTGSSNPGMQQDQAVQRSETIEAEDIEFEADGDLIDND